MAQIFEFPGASPGTPVALYTQNHIYSGTVVDRQDFPVGGGLWLKDVTVVPIRAEVPPDAVLRLDFVCVLWSQVVALGFPPELGELQQ